MKNFGAYSSHKANNLTEGLTSLSLEQFHLNELNPHEKAAVLKKFDESPELNKKAQAYLEYIKKDNEAFFASPKALDMLNHIKSRLADPSKDLEKKREHTIFSYLRPLSYGLAAAAVLAFVVLSPLTKIKNPEINAGTSDTVRVKGGGSSNEAETTELATALSKKHFAIFRQLGDRAEALKDNDFVSANDTLQIAYEAKDFSQGMIFSLDGRGNFTLHFPDQNNASTALEGPGMVLLPYAYQLDDAPYFEIFYFIQCNESFRPGLVLAILESAWENEQWDASLKNFPKKLPGIKNYTVSQITLKKS